MGEERKVCEEGIAILYVFDHKGRLREALSRSSDLLVYRQMKVAVKIGCADDRR